jgi:hypothetical protein
MDARLAPLIVLRGAVGAQRLVEVAASLLAWDRTNVTHVADGISHVAPEGGNLAGENRQRD